MRSDIDIVVVTNHHRPALIAPYLSGIPHKMSFTKDYDIPNGSKFKYDYLSAKPLGAYRCFRGHQDALAMSTKPYVLVFEDDAIPNKNNWITLVERCTPLLESYNCVSLHGRDVKGVSQRIPFDGMTFQMLKSIDNPVGKYTFTGKWALGSLAYIVKRNIAHAIISHPYDGLPMDLLLVNNLNAVILEPSPFDHERKFASLVENPKQTNS